ncbi:hypothetical protein PHLCEN_2v2347 [Hermanssonia centrifuga]|uniref:G-patch domain-containing protein n=1 Tax=Hermanssonia centrifuga TaxID=98765 RepID=A0A2R6RM65_9APHY|nr:hypothetical protein PHLCEN_2v2347 [Hermanssonia centrifuga]
MDEEDLAELRENRNLIDENEEMDLGGTEAELRRRAAAGTDTEDDSIANALAASLAPPPQDSVGARILRKMGWRIGQGIGPRITYEQRRTQDSASESLRPSQTDEVNDEEAQKHMYPRRDTPLLIVPRKDNSHGLGYVPGMSLNNSLGASGSGETKGPRLAAGFGLGALNDADEDDLDIYDGTLRSKGVRRVAYDAADDDDHKRMGSSLQPRYTGSNSRAPSTPSTSQIFRDGRPVLKGFALSNRPVVEDRWFPLPDIPKGWKPNPKRVWELDKNKENQTSLKGKERAEPPKTHAEWKKSLLSADERGSMLGETPLPATPRSVFDYMSQKDRERLDNIRNTLPGPRPSSASAAETMPPPPPPRIAGEIHIPQLHPSVAKAALSGFQPFTADPAKQARYTAFLHFISSDSTSLTDLGIKPNPGQSTEDFNKELEDYARSATVFKPLSAAMASRFKSAVVIENGPKIFEGLHTPSASSTLDEAEEKHEEKQDEDPRMTAIKLGMYGRLTREVTSWQPARLLCKRFGVKDPEADTAAADLASASQSTQDTAESDPNSAPGAPPLAITDGSVEGSLAQRKPGQRNLANIGLGEDEEQGKDTLTYQRPAMDVFKAIFASDDEESDDDDEPMPEVTKAEPTIGSIPAAVPTFGVPDSKPVHPVDEPSHPPTIADEKVDTASFKPTFVPRSDRESLKNKDKEKKEKKKKSAKTLVSFDTEEDGLQLTITAPKRERHKEKDGERKKKKRREKKENEEDDSMWVEKPAPEVVQALELDSIPSAPPPEMSQEAAAAGPPRGRKRAIDFM